MKKIINETCGAALVEFAIITPLLFVLLFGIIEFGIVLYDQAVITNASREGARWAAAYYINPTNANASHPQCSDVGTYITNPSYMNLKSKLISLASPKPDVKGCCGSGCTPSTGWPSTNGTYAYQNDGGNVGNADSVTVQYSYNSLVFGSLIKIINSSSSSLTLAATSVMRDENQN
jgi:Flp pilus assembly protein TadG